MLTATQFISKHDNERKGYDIIFTLKYNLFEEKKFLWLVKHPLAERKAEFLFSFINNTQLKKLWHRQNGTYDVVSHSNYRKI